MASSAPESVGRLVRGLAIAVGTILLAACSEPAAGTGPSLSGMPATATIAAQLSSAASATGPARPAAWVPADDGARITAVAQVDARIVDLTISSPAVGTAVVRLLLPAQFEAQPGRAWPVLYLLHGATGSHLDWTTYTDLEALTSSTDLLIAMPDGGGLGWYTDAWNDGHGGPPMWETFHVSEMRQLLERNWRASDRRALAGLSMGGLDALSYLGRHPDLFVGAASFSGVLDSLGAAPFDGSRAAFGDPVAQIAVWKAHDPRYLVPAMQGRVVYVAYGNGQAGPLDPSGVRTDETERWIATQNAAFVTELQRSHVAATVDAYGPGTHSWAYWERGLHDALPMLLKALDPGA